MSEQDYFISEFNLIEVSNTPLIPEIHLLDIDLNPNDLLTIFNDEVEVVYLDSSKEHQDWGRYSFIAFNPFLTLRYKEGSYELNGLIAKGDPFNVLNSIIEYYKTINTSTFPFVGGGIGYFSYDLVRDLESLPDISKEIVDIPTCYFNFYDQVIIYDHQQKKTYISILNIRKDRTKRLEYIFDKIQSSIQDKNHVNINVVQSPQTFNALSSTINSNNIDNRISNKTSFSSPFTKAHYTDTIERMRQYIKDGHIYIANLTHTFTGTTKKDYLAIYNDLRIINPAPFSAYMKLDGFKILSSSPERFMKIQNGRVETRPIKGTRPRGKTKEQDEKNKLALINSEKDKSELLMIVDLERNDLSKVCKPHSVKVEGLFDLETYATVFHLVATVKGELCDDKTAVDCIKACFPGGSITGTPKVRAMEIIEELEPTRRNLYTGCIGYLGFDGNADMNIVIRTILEKDGMVYIGVGGGITWESIAEEEYQETLDKALALFKSINHGKSFV